MYEIQRKLIKDIFNDMVKKGNKKIRIGNLHIFDDNGNIHAFADVSYMWSLNGWEKSVTHHDMVFVYKDGVWHSPLFC